MNTDSGSTRLSISDGAAAHSSGASKATPGPWRYEPGGGHAYNRISGSDSVQTNGWPERHNGISNASFTERVCENLGDVSLPGPAANVALICAAPDLLAALKDALLLIDNANRGAFANGVTSADGRDEGDYHACRIMDAASAAIARAENR